MTAVPISIFSAELRIVPNLHPEVSQHNSEKSAARLCAHPLPSKAFGFGFELTNTPSSDPQVQVADTSTLKQCYWRQLRC